MLWGGDDFAEQGFYRVSPLIEVSIRDKQSYQDLSIKTP